MTAEARMLRAWPLAKGRLGPPEAGRGRGGSSPRHRRDHGSADSLTSSFWPPGTFCGFKIPHRVGLCDRSGRTRSIWGSCRVGNRRGCVTGTVTLVTIAGICMVSPSSNLSHCRLDISKPGFQACHKNWFDQLMELSVSQSWLGKYLPRSQQALGEARFLGRCCRLLVTARGSLPDPGWGT